MDTYAYLFLSLYVLAILLVLVFARNDLARISLKLGLIGGVAGLVAELFYFRDYWLPPTILGKGNISFEDFIFGFSITALSAILYPALTNTAFKNTYTPYRKIFGLFFLVGAIALLVFNILFGINSIFVSSIIFALYSIIILMLRPDLVKPAVTSALFITGAIIVIYMILFNKVAPNFWNDYWFLVGTKYDVRILGNVPLTELLWYCTWILLGSVSYPFVTGKALISRKR